MNEGIPFREAAPRPPPAPFPPEQARARKMLAAVVDPSDEIRWAGQPVPDYAGSYEIVHFVTMIVGFVWGGMFCGIGIAMDQIVLTGLGLVGVAAVVWGAVAGPIVAWGRCVRVAYGVTDRCGVATDVLLHTEQICFFPIDLEVTKRTGDLGTIVLTKDPEVIFTRVRNPDAAFAALDRLPRKPPI